MSFARVKLIVAALAFFGWLAWLSVAVANKGTVQLLSTAQLTEATHIVVATVTADEAGGALPKVTITKVIRDSATDPLAGQAEIEIVRLDKAVTPLPVNNSRRISAGEFVLPLVKVGNLIRIAGLPRSPGFEGAVLDQPIVYPWTDDVKIQLRKIGVLKD